MIPPVLVRIRIRDDEHNLRLWFPLFLAWLILLPFVLIALVFLGLAAVFLPKRIRRMVFGILGSIYVCLCQLRYLHVDTESEDKRVRIQFV
jgi:lipopolysaccharide export LptBFGC system permease protein LptF